jgi:hypothetical protein
MKRPVKLLSIIAAATALSALAAPAVQAGNEIVKCIDGSGHVTLTDQPCSGGSETVRLSSEGMQSVQRHVLPAAELRHTGWTRPAVARPAPLSRDVATLREARRMLLLQESRPRLAGLN